MLEGLASGALLRAVHYDLLDAQDKNLRYCLRRVDGAELVRPGLAGGARMAHGCQWKVTVA